jgi:hypothetical protein
MKYRYLRKSDKPDKAKGDQYRTHGKRWVLTSRRGKATVEDGRRAGNPCVYRRPIANAHLSGGEAVRSK